MADERQMVLEQVDTGIAVLVPDVTRPGAWQLDMNGAAQSYVDLVDPTHLEFAYFRHLGYVVDLVAEPGLPLDALHLGGGAMTVPRYLAATRPGSRQDVVEIDGALAALVSRELPFDPSWQIDVHVADGRAVLERTPPHSLDLLVVDVYEGGSLPSHFAAAEFAAIAAQAVRRTGLYAGNILDGPPLAMVRTQVLGLRAVFADVCLVANLGLVGQRRGNVLVLASQRPLPVAELERRLAGDPFGCRPVVGEELDALVERGLP
ncbi:MAG: spermidine synthase [Mycobacteriales bacterium]